jgi:hypothetical protein
VRSSDNDFFFMYLTVDQIPHTAGGKSLVGAVILPPYMMGQKVVQKSPIYEGISKDHDDDGESPGQMGICSA